MLENKCSIIEAAEGLKRGMFIFIKGYCKNETKKIGGKEVVVYSEKSNVVLNADVSYENTHKRSAEKLDEIEKDENLKIEICRNFYVDSEGNEYNRKKDGRTLKEGVKETVTIKDKDWAEAVAKVRKSIVDPRKVTDNMDKIAPSVYEHGDTGKVYLRNVFVQSKVSVEERGKYPVSCSERVNVIANAIKDMLPIGKYRTYVLDDEMIDMLADDKGNIKKESRFEYVAMMGDHVSSSSSSED